MQAQPTPHLLPATVLRELLARFRVPADSGRQRAAQERRWRKALAAAHPQLEQDSVLPGIEVSYIDL